MAIFFEHIKGAMQSGNDLFYSWIKWAYSTTNKWPSIYFQQDGSAQLTDLGQIITTGPTNGVQKFASHKKIDFNGYGGLRFFSSNELIGQILLAQGDHSDYVSINGKLVFENSNSSFVFSAPTDFSGETIFTSTPNFKNGFTVNTDKTIINNQGVISTEGSITSVSSITGLYFNSTSDKRAKKDITPLSINALDIIKKVQVYTFNYKDSNIPSLGILAQDLKDLDINGFNLIDNLTATGEDGDYMKVKETKLIYILWKAIQEQQLQINSLQNLVESLSSK